MSVNQGREGQLQQSGAQRHTERDIRRRTLSQNFLRGSSAVNEFMKLVDLTPDDLVVEVGAGTGILTTAMAQRCGELIAYEVDDSLADELNRKTSRFLNVHVIIGDFLASVPPSEPFKVVANVPFSVTMPVVDWCLNAVALDSATIITQLEFAKKRAGSYGRWSLVTVETWPEFAWELRGRIARTQFRPVPKMDAGVLYIDHRERPLVPRQKMAAYRKMVELGFSGVGGSLYASFSRRYPTRQVAEAFRRAQVDRSTVVAFVHPDSWLRIFDFLEGERV